MYRAYSIYAFDHSIIRRGIDLIFKPLSRPKFWCHWLVAFMMLSTLIDTHPSHHFCDRGRRIAIYCTFLPKNTALLEISMAFLFKITDFWSKILCISSFIQFYLSIYLSIFLSFHSLKITYFDFIKNKIKIKSIPNEIDILFLFLIKI